MGRKRALWVALALVAGLTAAISPAAPAQASPLSFTDINPDGPSNNPPLSATGGRVNGLAEAPATPGLFYASSEFGGLYKTTDSATSWTRQNSHLPTVQWDVAVHPTDSNIVIATSFYDGRTNSTSGIVRSTDGGATWTKPATATPPGGYTCAAARVAEPSAFGVTFDGDNVYVGTNCGLARSSDAGATWTFIDPTAATTASDIWGVVASGSVVDICGDDGHRRSTSNGDAGTWTTTSTLASGRCSLARSPDENYVLYAAVGSSFRESLDGGVTWTSFSLPTGFNPGSRIPFVVTNNRSGNSGRDFDLWVGTGVTLFRAPCTSPSPLATGGATRCTAAASWDGPFTRTRGAHDDTGDIAFDTSVADDRCPVLFSNDGGVYSNTITASPGCHTPLWTEANSGLHGLWLYEMEAATQTGADPEDLYLGAQDNGTMASTNAGAANPTWAYPNCCDAFNIVASPTRVVWDTFSPYGLHRSVPGMSPQNEVATLPPGCCTQGYALFNFHDYIDQVPGTENYVAVTSSGAYLTSDITAAPTTWTQLGSASTPANGWCAIHASTDGTTPVFYAQTQCIGVFEGSPASQVWRFSGTNPSGTWTRIDNNDGITGGFGIISVDENNPNRLYGSNLSGPAGARMVFSNDGGTNWDPDPDLDRLMTGNGDFPMTNTRGATSFTGFGGYKQPSMVEFSTVNPNLIVAGGRDSGVFISSDSGANWALLTDPRRPDLSGTPHLPRPWFAHFDTVGSTERVYVGTQGRGAWRLSLPGGDMAVTKADSPDPVIAGENLTYTVVVSNNGSEVAPNPSMTDVLPTGVEFQSITQSGGPLWDCSTPAVGSSGTVYCTDDSMASGQSTTFTIAVKVPASTADNASLSNTASTAAGVVESDSTNNSATSSTLVQTEADMSLSKTGTTSTEVGTNASYTVTATNNGPSDAQAVTITDTLPIGNTFLSATPSSGGSCTTPTVGSTTATGNNTVSCSWTGATTPGSTRSVIIVLRMMNPGNNVDTATVSSTTDDPDLSNNSGSLSTSVTCDIEGTPGNDRLTGTSGNDSICGYGGDDTITGGGGNDVIIGGTGNDVLVGGSGNDEIHGNEGNDTLYGQSGADKMYGETGNDRLYGGTGYDNPIDGGPQTDVCYRQTDGGNRVNCESGS